MSKSQLSTARITVQAHPGAKRNQVVRFEEGVWHIRVAAPPAEGKANKALFEFLSEVLDVPKSRIWIEKGATSHRKVVGVEGVSQDRVQGRLRASSES